MWVSIIALLKEYNKCERDDGDRKREPAPDLPFYNTYSPLW